jgi:mono/diheme cytochrome c family protein
MQPRTLLALCVLGLFTVFCVPGVAEPQPPAKPAAVDYNRDVRPILAKNCFACHGPDIGQRAAGLRLDVREAAVKERRHGAAVVPGKPDKSALVARITATDETERMPPKETGNHLSSEQVATLKRWIAEGRLRRALGLGQAAAPCPARGRQGGAGPQQ